MGADHNIIATRQRFRYKSCNLRTLVTYGKTPYQTDKLI